MTDEATVPLLTPEVIAVANAIRIQWLEGAGDWLAIARAAITALDLHRSLVAAAPTAAKPAAD